MSNLDKLIQFEIDGMRLTRLLVAQTLDAMELSASSPVGKALKDAEPGDEREVQAPGGTVRVRLVEVKEESREHSC